MHTQSISKFMEKIPLQWQGVDNFYLIHLPDDNVDSTEGIYLQNIRLRLDYYIRYKI